jgi:hypothetical protein
MYQIRYTCRVLTKNGFWSQVSDALFIIFFVYLTTLLVVQTIYRWILGWLSEHWIWKDVERSGCDIILYNNQVFAWGTEENHEHLSIVLCQPRTKPNIYGIQVSFLAWSNLIGTMAYQSLISGFIIVRYVTATSSAPNATMDTLRVYE